MKLFPYFEAAMDLNEILALIASLVGEPEIPERFASYMRGGEVAAYPITVEPCPTPLGRDEIEGETIICGTVNVPERHDVPDGQRIDLFFAVMRAQSSYPEPDPVLHLHGGPGGGVVSRVEMFAEIFEPMRQTRDIVLFDQRASVLSAKSTTCRGALDRSLGDVITGTFSFTETSPEGNRTMPSALLRDCVAEMEAAGTDLAAYNTEENASDTVALMQALEYETYNIHGISYGTRLALEILRSHPNNVRSAVIDGVAPPQVPLYDTLAFPGSEVIEITLAECAADAACNAAFPDFREVLRDTLDRAAAGELVSKSGDPLPVIAVLTPFLARNGTYADPSAATALIPAFVYDIARMADGEPTPIVDQIIAADGYPRRTSPLDGVRDGLLDVEIAALDEAESSAQVAVQSNTALEGAIDALRERLFETEVPLAGIFDDEMIRGAGDILQDEDRRRAALLGYAQLREGEPDPEALRNYVRDTFPEESQPRLLALIDAMSDAEVDAIFAKVQRGVSQTLKETAGNLHNWIYACQESIPFNSLEGFRQTSATLPWPEVALIYEQVATEFFAACSAFTPVERPGFHDPVVSDIPVLSIGGTWDMQTAPSWPALAAETLPNAQTFLIPEAGHGAIAYQDCVADMTQAFLTNPMRRLPDTCVEQARPIFHIP
ncbi:MAG: alpha/beta hydrolase [Pseudomonadota bacterium]